MQNTSTLPWPSGERHHELPPSVATFIADRLEDQILEGRRAPGSPLLQLQLVEEFGVSRMPVRDALALLEQRHLAVRVPRKGMIVRPVTAQSVRAIFAARRLLETEIIRLAVASLADDDLATLETIVARQRAAAVVGDLAALRAADRTFHATIWHAAGNEVLEELAATVWRRALQARSVGHRLPGWGAKSVLRHERIVQALRQRDVREAVAAVVGAVEAAETEILAQLDAVEAAETGARPRLATGEAASAGEPDVGAEGEATAP